ncbi:hypothetical protein NDU88_003257 [Pleurodeles waltl]|uniref:Uncharacterized protein n=1 Tax=Pleurodeles waltl TaxID=8319 RepID=A0AAV7TQP9_PLEWA|nr:hypothetical protein NDU88_003257 [Pleurodeles waltl]
MPTKPVWAVPLRQEKARYLCGIKARGLATEANLFTASAYRQGKARPLYALSQNKTERPAQTIPRFTPCAGPTLPQSDPPCPRGIDTVDTSNPEVLREATNPIAHPGDNRQREPFCAVTRLQKEELKDVEGGDDMRTRTPKLGDSKGKKGRRMAAEFSSKTVKRDRSLDGKTHQRPGRRPTQAPATLGEERGQFRCME